MKIRKPDLDRIIKASGKSRREVAEEAGVDESTIRRLIERDDSFPSVKNAVRIAEAVGKNPAELWMPEAVQHLSVVAQEDIPKTRYGGEVAAGLWIEANDIDAFFGDIDDDLSVTMPLMHPGLEKTTWLVRGTSMDKLGIVDGTFIVTVRYEDLRGDRLVEGDVVVVRRTDGNKIEHSCKQIAARSDGRFELWPRSTDPRWQIPLVIAPEDHDRDITVEVIGKVITYFAKL